MAQKSSQRGFTLIEVMIVVAIIAILTAVALPSYREQVIRTRRGAAAACLTEFTQHMERRYTTAIAYTGATLPTVTCATELANSYNFAFAVDPTAIAYTVNAIPLGGQANDAMCAILSVNQLGIKSVSGTESGVDGGRACWK